MLRKPKVQVPGLPEVPNPALDIRGYCELLCQPGDHLPSAPSAPLLCEASKPAFVEACAVHQAAGWDPTWHRGTAQGSHFCACVKSDRRAVAQPWWGVRTLAELWFCTQWAGLPFPGWCCTPYKVPSPQETPSLWGFLGSNGVS